MNTFSQSSPAVLVVEDEALVAMFVEEALHDLGLGCEVFTRGRPALDAVASRSFIAAVLDMGLPDIAGEEIVAALLQRDPTMPIIITSGHDQVDLELKFKGVRRIRVLSKPFDAEMLCVELKALDVVNAAEPCSWTQQHSQNSFSPSA
jgi:DNA-binding response OmpR family regulator